MVNHSLMEARGSTMEKSKCQWMLGIDDHFQQHNRPSRTIKVA